MNSRAFLSLLLVAITGAMAGCQAGPRWAWWKHEAVPEDTSLVARSAEPALPSTQSTPDPVPTPGSAAPPSSANLAAAKAATTPPGSPLPTSSATTIASAPTAAYPPTTPAPTPYADANSAYSSIAAAPSTTRTAPAAGGPYDPNAYQPVQAASTTMQTASAMPADRYGNLSSQVSSNVGRYGTTPEVSVESTPGALSDQHATAPSAYAPPAPTAQSQAFTTPEVGSSVAGNGATSPTAGDRYGTPVTDRYMMPTTAANATESFNPAAGVDPAISPEATAAATTPVAPSTVELSAPAGQYRPAGTSTYVAGTASRRVDVATRPESPTTPAPRTLPDVGSDQPSSTAPAVTTPDYRY